MDFGGLPDIEGISFALPEVPDRSRRMLARGRPAAGDWLYIGAPAWARKDWLGKLYPTGTPPRDFLRCYARALNAIELNATFYNIPDEDTLDSWSLDTPERFRFCPKIHQSISHLHGLDGVQSETHAFCQRLARLGDRLGPALLQLPPWFASDRLATLDRFLGTLPRDFRVCVELRHASWFTGNMLRSPTVDVLEKHRAAAVITDVAGRRDVCHASLTAPFTMVRFVGCALHPSDRPRVDAWIERLLEWRTQGLETACSSSTSPTISWHPS